MLLFLQFHGFCLILSVCTFNYLPKVDYPSLPTLAAFSNKAFSRKTSLPVTNLHLLTFPCDNAGILAFFA